MRSGSSYQAKEIGVASSTQGRISAPALFIIRGNKMGKQLEKDTVAVLIHVPRELYEEYLNSLQNRSLKRQSYSAKIFCKAMKRDVEEYKNNPGE